METRERLLVAENLLSATNMNLLKVFICKLVMIYFLMERLKMNFLRFRARSFLIRSSFKSINISSIEISLFLSESSISFLTFLFLEITLIVA
ncbi:MAG: hypothetical protein Ct9H90mP22_5040 [Gammaproteobacteria bacterium]|nr:MAG: hypothetical protein Ct9H90mP22_5040 [Gammaproteobacteria bacterium]